jgi:predicted ArsR family transcriptional regulator
MAAVSPAPTGPVPYRLLTLLRDTGPLSRAELGDHLGVPRARALAEIDALIAAG